LCLDNTEQLLLQLQSIIPVMYAPETNDQYDNSDFLFTYYIGSLLLSLMQLMDMVVRETKPRRNGNDYIHLLCRQVKMNSLAKRQYLLFC